MNSLISISALWWYKFKLWICQLLGLRMTLTLPPLPPENIKIDSTRVTNVIKFLGDDGLWYFYCQIDGEIHVLIWTQDLEDWFVTSGIHFSSIENDFRKTYYPLARDVVIPNKAINQRKFKR